MTKGFKIIPCFCRFKETEHGSPSQASIPSVIKIIIFRLLSSGGKSLTDCSKEYAIGVVPFGIRYLSFCRICPAFPGLNGTSSFVSLQSCGGTGLWCPYTRKAICILSNCSRLSIIWIKYLRAIFIFLSLSHVPYML